MKTITSILMAVDFFLIMGLVTLQIGCMSSTPQTNLNNDINSNVIVAPTTTVTNVISNQTGGSSFNNELYIWDDWNIK